MGWPGWRDMARALGSTAAPISQGIPLLWWLTASLLTLDHDL